MVIGQIIGFRKIDLFMWIESILALISFFLLGCSVQEEVFIGMDLGESDEEVMGEAANTYSVISFVATNVAIWSNNKSLF